MNGSMFTIIGPRTRRAGVVIAVTALAALPVSACGSSESTPPTAEELAGSLVTVDDFDGEWTVNVPPDAGDAAISGVVTEEQQALLPRFEFCDEAPEAARQANDDLRWAAFRQLDLTVDDPVEPPDDRTGHMVFVQQYLAADEADATTATFEALRDGVTACLGDIPAGEEGPGRADAWALPDVGDDRVGVSTVMAEEGGWAEWRISNAIVRDGTVLMSFVIVDITAGVEPLYTPDELASMVELAVDRLPN